MRILAFDSADSSETEKPLAEHQQQQHPKVITREVKGERQDKAAIENFEFELFVVCLT